MDQLHEEKEDLEGMFSNLGLLSSGKCPDGEGCKRIRCFFGHAGQSRPPPRPTTTTSTSSIKKRPLDEVKDAPSSSSTVKTVNKSVDSAPAAKVAKPTPISKVSRITRYISDTRYLLLAE